MLTLTCCISVTTCCLQQTCREKDARTFWLYGIIEWSTTLIFTAVHVCPFSPCKQPISTPKGSCDWGCDWVQSNYLKRQQDQTVAHPRDAYEHKVDWFFYFFFYFRFSFAPSSSLIESNMHILSPYSSGLLETIVPVFSCDFLVQDDWSTWVSEQSTIVNVPCSRRAQRCTAEVD